MDNKLEIGKRYLIRAHVSDAQIIEAHPREYSPSGAYVRLGGVGWVKLDDVMVLEEMPLKEPTGGGAFQQQQQQQQKPDSTAAAPSGAPGTDAAPVSLTPAMTGSGAEGPVGTEAAAQN